MPFYIGGVPYVSTTPPDSPTTSRHSPGTPPFPWTHSDREDGSLHFGFCHIGAFNKACRCNMVACSYLSTTVAGGARLCAPAVAITGRRAAGILPARTLRASSVQSRSTSVDTSAQPSTTEASAVSVLLRRAARHRRCNAPVKKVHCRHHVMFPIRSTSGHHVRLS